MNANSVVRELVYGRTDYFADIVIVTPELAERLLRYHNSRNRKFQEATADRYASDMRRGAWRKGSAAIGIDTDGQLTNGQHRLAAVVKSGCTVEMPFIFNCEPESRLKEDTLRPRNEADRLQLSGFPDADRNIVPVAKAFLSQPMLSRVRISDETLAKCLSTYRELFADVDALCSGGDGVLDHAVIKAAIARASLIHGLSRLEQFATVGKTGVALCVEDQAAATYARWAKGNPIRQGGSTHRVAFYKYTQAALRAFLAGRPLLKLYAADGDLFPLPEDAKSWLKKDAMYLRGSEWKYKQELPQMPPLPAESVV
jgi:hypothetical protein